VVIALCVYKADKICHNLYLPTNFGYQLYWHSP